MNEQPLSVKQRIFTKRIYQLLDWLYGHGYEVTFGEVYRPPETAKLYAAEGTGSVNSLHCIRLAVDLNLWIDGHYLADTQAYLPAGVFWEGLSTPEARCVWGGRFERHDGDHFSIAHGGQG